MNDADKRLELGIFPVTDVRLGDKTSYDDSVVTVDADGLAERPARGPATRRRAIRRCPPR